MSTLHFKERIETHPAIQELNQLRAARRAVRVDDADPAMREGYARYLRVVRHVAGRLTFIDPVLTTVSSLNKVQKAAAQLRARHDTLVAEKNWNELNTLADALIDALPPANAALPTASEYSEALATFEGDATDRVLELSDEVAKATEETARIAQELVKLREEMATHDQHVEAQKTRIDSLVTDEQARYAQAEQERNTQFTKALQEQGARASDQVSKAANDIAQLLDEREAAANDLLENQKERATAALTELQEQLDRGSKIVGLIGNTGMAGHYQRVANAEWWAAEVMRGLALIFFLLTGGVILWVVRDIHADDLGSSRWQIGLFRLAIGVVLLAPAFYCARESSRHRRVETRNRALELELSSIRPFLEPLPEERAQAIIERKADQYFGSVEPLPSDEEAQSLREVYLRGDKALKIVERLAKALKS